jgi:hypothetical protein
VEILLHAILLPLAWAACALLTIVMATGAAGVISLFIARLR